MEKKTLLALLKEINAHLASFEQQWDDAMKIVKAQTEGK